MNQFLIGPHTSTKGGVANALLEGKALEATTIQFFTSNQKQWKGRVLAAEDIEHWEKIREETGLKSLMSHSSYLINLGSSDLENLEKSRKAFQEEIERCQKLKVSYLNFHPGAALKAHVEECLNRIVESLLMFTPLFKDDSLKLLLETTAGQGSSVGHTFEQLAYIIQRVEGKIPIAVCIDTCHVFAAGYDVRTPENWNDLLEKFDRIIGKNYLQAFHLNDSLKELGSKVDRHAHLGEGKIGWKCFEFLMQDKRVSHLPKYLETPGGPSRWKEEIQALKNLYKPPSISPSF